MRRIWRRACGAICWVLLLLCSSGCFGPLKVMPTPNLYAGSNSKPFASVPAELQQNQVEVLYLTDRANEGKSPAAPKYGTKRSRSLAYGVCQVQLGEHVSWDQLVQASSTRHREVVLTREVARTTELGRFWPTPRKFGEPLVGLPSTQPALLKQEIGPELENFQHALQKQLAKSPVKEVYLYVHGYNNSLEEGVTTIAQLWHFLGRRGVAVAYSWPAGNSGLLRGYTTDRESSQFTVYHMQEALQAISTCPQVQKVHLIAHSRGTDVLTSALRELHLQITAAGGSTRDALKLGNMVLAAPDLDFDVVMQDVATSRLGRVPEQTAIYVHKNDQALGMAEWLFGGFGRLGNLRSDMFSPEELAALRRTQTVQIINVRVEEAGALGHSYFYASPAVSSDLILLLRYGLRPGGENGRPLGAGADGFWNLDDSYPAGSSGGPGPSSQPLEMRTGFGAH